MSDEEIRDLTEHVAQAIWEADCGPVSYTWNDVSDGGRSKWRRYARAAIAAMPAEEAS